MSFNNQTTENEKTGEFNNLPVYFQNLVLNTKESQMDVKFTSFVVFLHEKKSLNNNADPRSLVQVWKNLDTESKQYYENLAKIINKIIEV
jgi:hypothetical protein